ncbi:MAG: hypothetical protein JXA97_02985 [Anaerolineales bacterium]|nr:hypothetical protein [Anaerolineales bacterium]
MKERYFTTFELILLALLSALIVVAKIALRFPITLSGHSGIFWMAIMMVGAGVVPKRGAASVIGITSGLIAGFLGLGDYGALNTFISYTMVGVGTDLALLLLGDPAHMIAAPVAAAIGHLGKLLFKWFFGVVTGTPVGFIALGLAKAILGYIIFGALGGLLGALTLRALRRAGFFTYLAEKR